MDLERRQILGSVGVGIAIGLLGTPATATETERVFVHPRTDLVGDALDAIEAVGGDPVLEYDNFAFVVAKVPAENRDELRSDLRVSFVESDGDVGIPSDWTPSIPDILDPDDDIDCADHPDQRPSWGWERIGAGAAEAAGSGVDVGILDTGIESTHCTLSVAGGRNFTGSGRASDYEDRHGHGTHVAGITGALDNGIGVVGVAPDTNLYAVKVLDDRGSGRYSSLVAGIDWCMSNDVELISMSLGGESASSTVDEAIEAANSEGHLLVCAAGNDGNDADGSCGEESMTYPATHEDVVAVSAMNEDDTLAGYSSVGSAIELLAPGTEIDSTYVDNGYARASGTSAACPFVTGAAALVWQAHDEEGPGPNDAVRATLAETAETVLGTCEEGHGLVRTQTGGDDRETDTDGGGSTDGGDHEGSPNGGEISDDRRPSVFDRFAAIVGRIVECIRGLFR